MTTGAFSISRWRVLMMILRGLSGLPVMFAGTRGGAASALGAGVAVEQVLPRQLLDVARAELLDVGLEVHVAHGALRARPARVREEHVDERRRDVQVLGVRQVVEEGEDEQRVRPPEELEAE